ncbi:MAG TPA: S41 family peptidase [Pseudomonadales bacterium]|nr:S41 family peptidase [Pseudomonadales bacterium]
MRTLSCLGRKKIGSLSGNIITGFTLAALTVALSSCGGSSKGGNNNAFVESWRSGIFEPSSKFAAMCASPRKGVDPYSGAAYPDKQGSYITENNWLRSWTNEYYLWYSEVADNNPADYSTPAYFDLLKTMATTDSGADKDKFHFSYDTATWESLSYSGVEAGYGIRFALLSRTPPRSLKIGLVEPNAPAEVTNANLTRGAEIIAIDGIDLVNTTVASEIDALNEAMSPDTVGESHRFSIRDVGATDAREVVLTSANVTTTPVQNVKTISGGSGTVGYLLFNDHIATAESELVDAFTTLKNANITDLVLDLRYNGGGYLDIASQVAYMIAGASATTGKIFENIVFNDKHTIYNPFTGDLLAPTPFHNTTLGFSTTPGQALPTLDLPRVFVLTTESTCSASEAIINGLRGIGVTVVEIGATTCGKPYGFYPEDNCGTTYFSIQFKGENEAGFGDYSDGFTPANDAISGGVMVTGCAVADDFNHELGNSSEAMLAAALTYSAAATCPAASYNYSPSHVSARSRSVLDVKPLHLSPLRENRILRKH